MREAQERAEELSFAVLLTPEGAINNGVFHPSKRTNLFAQLKKTLADLLARQNDGRHIGNAEVGTEVTKDSIFPDRRRPNILKIPSLSGPAGAKAKPGSVDHLRVRSGDGNRGI